MSLKRTRYRVRLNSITGLTQRFLCYLKFIFTLIFYKCIYTNVPFLIFRGWIRLSSSILPPYKRMISREGPQFATRYGQISSVLWIIECHLITYEVEVVVGQKRCDLMRFAVSRYNLTAYDRLKGIETSSQSPCLVKISAFYSAVF